MASLVIKVKYEETLRRFNVAINGDRRLDLSIEGLRLKICSLFTLPSDSQFRLTYKDEDDDLVTLVDDDDLHDVVRQGLDPVRITVHLISDQKPQSSSAPSSGSSLNHNAIKTVNSDENGSIRSDILKRPTFRFVNEPQSEAMKFYGLPKVGPSHENTILSNSRLGNDTKPSSDGRKHEGAKPIRVEKRSQVTGLGVSVNKPPLSPSFPLYSSYNNKWSQSCDGNKNKDVFVKPPSNPSVPLFLSYKNMWSESGHGNKNKNVFEVEREFDLLRSEKELTCNAAKRAAGFQSYPAPACGQSFKQIHPPNRNLNKTDNMTSIVHTGITCDGCGLHPISGPRFKSKVRYNYDLCRGCFLRVGNEMDYCRINLPLGYKPPPLSVKASDADSMRSVFHNGITCDGCGVLPISGPRFKSKVKYNYDLCNICFSQTGNYLDYARIDVPLTYHHLDRAPDVDHLGVIIHNGVFCDGCGVSPIRGPRFKSKVRHDYDLCNSCFLWTTGNDDKEYVRITRLDSPLAPKHLQSVTVPEVKSPSPYKAEPWKYPILKRDSCLIKHVNIPNGTTMAPLTPFIKIWRMRNNGTVPWFRGLHLIWVGGDRFSPSDSVEIQVPDFGVDIGEELNIAVRFIAPELPGHYTSFWRMVSGQMFGEQVSVQIRVDPFLDLTGEILRTLDLNLPPVGSKTVFPEVAKVKAEPGLDIEVTNSNAPSIVDQNRKIQMIALNLEINDDLPPADNANGPGSPVGPSSYSIPEGSTPIQSDPTSDTCGEVLPSSVSYPEADASSDSIPEGSTPTQSDPASNNSGELLPSSVSYPEADASSYSIPEASTPVQSDPTSDNYGEFLAASSNAGDLDNNGTLEKNINLDQVNDKTETEEKLLKELEQMGFKQIELEEEGDSEESVDDDLSDDSDWDPILEELMEMGFEDKDANKKLLAKNNGSITRVVMDLIAEEKA